jgi:predicted  nucleic acid-binding Zn-ribbon protein
MKTMKYRKRCFDQIEGIVGENKALTREVDRLQLEVEKASTDRAAQEEQMADLSQRLADKEKEKKGKAKDFHSVLSPVPF